MPELLAPTAVVPQLELPEIHLIEGYSKSMKTSIGKAAELALTQSGLLVFRDDAGSFFRKITVSSLEELVAIGVEDPTQADFDAASRDVLDAGIPYDTQRPWTDLHSQRVDDVVGRVSQAVHVQSAAAKWWGVTADRAVAARANVLMLDGRNPSARLGSWLAKNAASIAMELFCICDPGIAAERTLSGNGISDPTEQQVREARASIVGRRYMDRKREELPYEAPRSYVICEPDSSPSEVIERARRRGEEGMPLPIRINTGKLERVAMDDLAGALALAATGLLQ